MKTRRIVLPLSMALALAAGCEKKPSAETPAAGGGTPAPDAGKMMDAAKPAVDQAAKEVKDAASTATADATAKANAVIEQAKSLVGQNKYTDALTTLQQLASMKLTPEQEQLVAGLKEQIQKAMASKAATDAAGAAGDLLPKK
jgi:hypothetical protein